MEETILEVENVLKKIREKSKTEWICVKFNKQTIYFGEHETKEEKKKRHGLGIQFYYSNIDKNDDCQASKYEGQWQNDQRYGYGHVEYLDGSSYMGQFKNDQREGYGNMKYNNGWQYKGQWKNNKMEGKGELTNPQGQTMSRVFKKNFVQLDKNDGIFAWPFYDQQQLNQFIKVQKEKIHENDNQKSHNQFFVEKTNQIEQIGYKISQSNSMNRIPLLLFSTNNQLSKYELLSQLGGLSNSGHKYNEVSLPLLNYLNQQNHQKQLQEYKHKVKCGISQSISQGLLFVINLDDVSQNEQEDSLPENMEHDENVYADLREFYNQEWFPKQIWDRTKLARPELLSRLTKGTDYAATDEIHKDFRIILWSSYMIDGELRNKKIVEKFDKRFSHIIPIGTVDLILITSA